MRKLSEKVPNSQGTHDGVRWAPGECELAVFNCTPRWSASAKIGLPKRSLGGKAAIQETGFWAGMYTQRSSGVCRLVRGFWEDGGGGRGEPEYAERGRPTAPKAHSLPFP